MKKITYFLLVTALLSVFSFRAFAADTANPTNVKNVKVVAAMDGAVKLGWSKATDDVGVVGYKVYYGLTSVTQKGKTYDKNIDAKNVQEFTVSGLTNDTKYYFTVIAYDAAGNESLAWGNEVSATPAKGSGSGSGAGSDIGSDKTAPQVADASAIDNQDVKVVFSEEIVLPKSNPQDAFDIEDQDKFQPLLVTDARMDATDTSNKTVILGTSKQKENAAYKLTVGIDVKDKAGNPIVSGTSDTAPFKGSGVEKPAEDKKGPSITKVESMDNTHFIVNFDETVVLSIDPSEDFVITAESDNTKKLDVLGVKLGTNSANVEDATAVITTSPQEAVKYKVKVTNVKDGSGNKVSDTKNSGSFAGTAAATGGDQLKDIIPPKDVVNFIADKILNGKQYTVTLNWKIPAENKDTEKQLIYKSTDKGVNYGNEATLASDKTQYKAEKMDPGEYWFKITEKDFAGNESKGVITKIVLPKTGPEMIGLVAFSLIAGRIVGRKKRKK
ncbi:fibronectin type III domain-containing protein [Candidatus Peregrinibacteria bacterium]|nr:fibronectin type III domain-containing protein [Candidatus Peregrinibacteria bacterium]